MQFINEKYLFFRCLGSQKVMSHYARFAREAASEVTNKLKFTHALNVIFQNLNRWEFKLNIFV